MTTDIMGNLFDGYRKINPRDRRDTEVHLAASTARAIAVTLPDVDFKFEDYMTDGAMLLGIMCRRDDTVPYGEFRFVTENAQERAIRRIRDQFGRNVVNVVEPLAFLPEVVPAPKPTLRALLRHWLRRH